MKRQLIVTIKQPRDLKAFNNKGVIFLDLEKFKEAIDCFDKIIEIKDDSADAWYKKGLALFLLDEKEKALECFDKALALNPYKKFIWIPKGLTLFHLGRFEEASDAFKKGETDLIKHLIGQKNKPAKTKVL